MSSEDLKSLIVTDPDIVDEGIDVSGLRTQTDTNPRLLASIADFPGISYDPTEFSYLSDLNELFAYGLPEGNTSGAVTPPVTTAPDTGGGGPTAATTTTPSDPSSSLTQSGTFGGQPTFTTTPGTTVDDITGDITNPDGTYGGNIVDEVALTGGLTQSGTFGGQPTFTTTPGTTVNNITGDITNSDGTYGGNIVDEVALTGETTTLPSGDVFATDDPMLQEKIDFTPEQESTLQNIFSQAGQTVEGAMDQLSKIPGAVADFANKTVDLFGKKLNVGKTIFSGIANKIAGGPVSLIFDVAKEFLPEDNIAPSTNIARSTGLLQGDNTKTQDIYGINTQTSFDPVKSTISYNNYNVEQVDKLNNSLTNVGKKYGATWNEELGVYTGLGAKKAKDMTTGMRTQLKDRKEYLDAINKDPLYSGDIQDTGDASIAEQIAEQNRITGDLPGGGNILDEFAPSGPITTDITSDQIDEFSTAPSGPITTDITSDQIDEFSTAPAPAPSAPQGGGGRDRGDSPTPSTSSVNEADVEAGLATESISDYTGGGGGGGGGGCFLKGTQVTMADGSTKAIEQVDLGDNVAKGGKVFATGKFLVENLHDYKGIKVSGSHMVSEDDNWVRVEDSKHGKPLGNNEHTVYVFGSENRRILINGITFTDYFETTEQQKLIDNEKDFFNNWKTYENKIDQDNINILNAS